MKGNKVTKKNINTKPKEEEFYIEQLRERSRDLFRVKPEVIDGALLNYKKEKITKTEVQKRINDFLNKEVK